MADEREHREHRLHQHTVLPFAALTQFEVGGIALRGMEAGVTQDNHPSVHVLNEPLKGVIGDIRGGTRPPHDQPPLIEQQTEFAADNPAMIGETFAADLLRTPAFADGMDQLDAIRVDDPQHRWGGQEDFRPVVMRLEEPKEPGPLGEVGKQGPIVACQPAIEGAVAHKRELTALSPCSTLSSCRLLLSVRACPGSMVQPGSHRGFLMPPTPSTTAEKAAQTGEARLETGLRPPALHLLPQRIQPQTAHQPTAHYYGRGGRGGTQQRPQPGRRAFVQGPGKYERPRRCFATRAVLAAYLAEREQLLHFFKYQ